MVYSQVAPRSPILGDRLGNRGPDQSPYDVLGPGESTSKSASPTESRTDIEMLWLSKLAPQVNFHVEK